jgi:iron complex outermembrane recepter protein
MRFIVGFVLALGVGFSAVSAEEKSVGQVTVEGQRVKSAGATKADVPLEETPQAISVVSADWIKQQGITRLADALRTVAGVSRSSTYGYYDAYQIRGYDAAYGSVYLDGLISANVAGANNELAGLEQVEVVKGPASMLFGSAPLGGIVNLVSKRPRAETFLDTGIATGSYGLLETAIDANAPLTQSDALLGRLNVVYRDSDDFVNFSDRQRIYVAPALTWNIAERTQLTFLSRYERDRDSPWSPVSAWGTVLPSVNGASPIDFSVNDDASNGERAIHDQDHKHIGYAFDHSFSDTLSLNQTLRFTHRKVYWNNWVFVAGFLDSNIVDGVQQGHVMGRFVYGPFRQRDKDFAVDTRMNARLVTGSVGHAISFGIDFRRNNYRLGDEGGNFDPAGNPLDVLAPDYSTPLLHDPIWAYTNDGSSRQTGYYLQDHIQLTERLTATLGGRWDEVLTDDVKDQKFSPRIGATLKVAPSAWLYASWSKSFTPQPGFLTAAGDPVVPETGRNIEAGIKLGSREGIVNGTVAIFELTRQNVATEDPANPFFSVVTGEQRSRGLEVEGAWRPVQPLMLSLAYAYLDAEVTKDNLFVIGAPLANVPKHSINLYSEYALTQSLGASFGVLYNSRKNATLFPEDLDGDGEFDPISLFELPSYTIMDAGLSYLTGPWQMRLNVNNLLDKRYFPDACCVDRVTPGEPRNYRFSVQRKF